MTFRRNFAGYATAILVCAGRGTIRQTVKHARGKRRIESISLGLTHLEDIMDMKMRADKIAI